MLALVFALPAVAVEKEKEKPASLIGATKEQVYARLGDPRSQIKGGGREVMFFPKIKVTLRNDVVIETEEVSDEPAPTRRAAETPVVAPAPAAAADTADSSKTRKASPAVPVTPSPAPAEAPAPAIAADTTAEAKAAAAHAAPHDLEIKSVRAPAANAPRPVPKSSTKASAPSPAPATTAAVATAATSPAAPVAATKSGTAVAPSAAPATAPAGGAPAEAAVSTPTVAATDEKPATPAEPTEATEPAEKATKKAPPRRFFRRHVDPDSGLPEVSLFSAQTYVFGFAVAGAVAFLFWRTRQRKLLLAATTVSNTPFDEPVVADTSALFTSDLLAKLEWKRFEELVAAYYVKTGVVAVRTKTGPDSPVHLKISWKGEAKPFACVQCHASPAGLLRAAPLQELFAALTAADIRRGYVVTNGKFNVEARDFAEEKHFTLLPGDLLLEKLNALPPAARAELIQTTTAGDYTTPTCPKCDAKMVRTEEGGWRCTNHPRCDAVLPARKTA